MNWAIGNAYPQAKAAGPFHLLVPFPRLAEPVSRVSPAEPLPDDLPDYLVYVTRNALLAATTSLTKGSTETHSFFVKLCQVLAFDRFMRSVTAWWMPAMAPLYASAAQSWMMAAPKQPTLAPFWGAGTSAPSKPQPSFGGGAAQPFASMASEPSTTYAAMMAMPAMFFAFTPIFLDSWRPSF